MACSSCRQPDGAGHLPNCSTRRSHSNRQTSADATRKNEKYSPHEDDELRRLKQSGKGWRAIGKALGRDPRSVAKRWGKIK
jgi:hypothetical protein